MLRADLLRPFAHWITPEVEPKRFDTRFFLAEMPAGQVCRDVGGEADERLWVRRRDALEQGLRLMPPTTTRWPGWPASPTCATALDTEREVTLVAPKLVVLPDDTRAVRRARRRRLPHVRPARTDRAPGDGDRRRSCSRPTPVR